MTQIKDTFKDEQGTLHTLADMLPAQPGDDDYIDSDNGQCCCGEYNCITEYSCWSSGY